MKRRSVEPGYYDRESLQLAREMAGLSEAEFAETSGLTMWAIKAIERGNRQPHEFEVERYATATGQDRANFQRSVKT